MKLGYYYLLGLVAGIALCGGLLWIDSATAGAQSPTCVLEDAVQGGPVSPPTAAVVGVECDGPATITWGLSVPPEALWGLGGAAFEPWDRQGAPIASAFGLDPLPDSAGIWWTGWVGTDECSFSPGGHTFSVQCDEAPPEGATLLIQLHTEGPVVGFIGHPFGESFTTTAVVVDPYQPPPTTTTTTVPTTTTEPPPSTTVPGPSEPPPSNPDDLSPVGSRESLQWLAALLAFAIGHQLTR